MRKFITDVLEIVGIGLVVAGFALISPISGLIAGGLGLLLIGYLSA